MTTLKEFLDSQRAKERKLRDAWNKQAEFVRQLEEETDQNMVAEPPSEGESEVNLELYKGLKTPQAIKELLETEDRPMEAPEITDALMASGFPGNRSSKKSFMKVGDNHHDLKERHNQGK